MKAPGEEIYGKSTQGTLSGVQRCRWRPGYSFSCCWLPPKSHEILRTFKHKITTIQMLYIEWLNWLVGALQASVRYVLRVKLDSTSASLRQMCRDCGFVVVRPLDLNHISPLDSGTPRHWTSAAAAYVDDQLPPVDVRPRHLLYTCLLRIEVSLSKFWLITHLPEFN